MVNIVAKLRAIPALQDIDESMLTSLSEGLSFKRFEKGQLVFSGGDPAHVCYVISYGAVKMTRILPQGKEVVMCFLRTGDFLGAAMMTHQNPRFPLTAVAMEDSGLIEIPRERYLSSWQANPLVARAVNVNIMNRMLEFQDDKSMTVSSVPQKVAKFLLRTLDQQPKNFGNRLSLKLSRKDVAERVGTTVETVIRTLSQWTQRGWIETHEQHIVIVNRSALEQVLSEE
ncbi:MAG: Crp/Fnr family transcriptional regulator [Bdellovibrionaceae bacterium]|nr:Crp/Fnr family transcriptional regulator [Pseudobdellovibrionaceae bacterium]